MKRIIRACVILVVLALFAACQSTDSDRMIDEKFDSWPISPEQSLIQSEAHGFSPMAYSTRSVIEFNLYFANAGSVKNWKVEMESAGVIRRTFNGTSDNMPATLVWDGKDSAGQIVPSGRYVATLIVTYNKKYTQGVAKSNYFVLESAAPSGTISYVPALFSPADPANVMTITIKGKSELARIESWTMTIFDPGWNLFRTYSGKWPNNTVIWDGKDLNGKSVLSAEDYPVIVDLRDEFGNTGKIEDLLPVDVIVTQDNMGYRIENSRIYFQNYTANYKDVPALMERQNFVRLNRLAETLKKYPGYKVKIVGHAVKVFWENKALGDIEQQKVLLPLSLARAEAVKSALIERGVNPDSIITEGVGSSDPVVPDSDYANRWQNRRIAIYLIK